MAITQKYRLMSIGTPLGDDVLLIRGISGFEELSRLSRYELDLLSEDEEIDFDQIVGKNVTVRIETTKGVTRYVNGLVSRFSQSRRVGRLASYRATIVPWLWLLTRTSDCRIFQEMTVPDIVKQTFRDHGLTDFDDRLTTTYREWEYCVQYCETDFNFVSRLMEQEGIYYYFEHENGKHTLVLCDAPSTHQPFSGYDTISYRPPGQATTDVEHIRDWHIEKVVQPGAYTHDDFDFKNPRKELEAQSKITRTHAASEFEIYNFPGQYTEFADGESYARIRIEEFGAQHEIASGSGDTRGVCTGCKFELEDYPRQDQCREYLVTSASLNAQSDEFVSGGGTGSFFDCSFTAIPADKQYRPARVTPKPLMQGPQSAVVVGPAGQEIYTDPHGRVKVQFHWDRRSAGDETSSCWIRVVQAWAGKKWGTIFIPRIGQELVIDFFEGDPDQPFCAGRLYNGEATPPYDLPAEKTKSTIKSNSSMGGQGYNEIRYEDEKGEEQIYVHAEKDEDVRVENDSKEWIGNDRHLIVEGSQYEKVTGSKHLHVVEDQFEKVVGDLHQTVTTNHNEKIGQSMSLEVGMKHDVKVGLSYKLKAMTIDLKADGQLNIEAPMINIKAGAMCTIDGGGVLTLKGGIVLINSGGNAQSAKAASPDAPTAPTDPLEADTDVAGEVDAAVTAPTRPTPATYSDAAMVMKQAAEDGTPFCEECERARQEAEAAQSGGEPGTGGTGSGTQQGGSASGSGGEGSGTQQGGTTSGSGGEGSGTQQGGTGGQTDHD
ncbi:MAG TPA: type VI secretion system tip protein VgrG [Planctomycetota bacterium]|nr:type VI secretion system tip protein VgrG [Planctomycetota bacterium]